MRRALIFLLLLCPPLARAAVPALLNEAIQKLIADNDRWAYTQSTQRLDKAGQAVGGLTVERFDPSQPTGRQWTLLQFSGHAPTGTERESWEAQKERSLRHRGAKTLDDMEKTLGDVLDLDHAAIAELDAGRQ